MLFSDAEMNGLTKGSSIAVVGGSGKGRGVGDGAGDQAGEHAHKHVGEDRNEDVGENSVRLSVRRIRSGGFLVELLC